MNRKKFFLTTITQKKFLNFNLIFFIPHTEKKMILLHVFAVMADHWTPDECFQHPSWLYVYFDSTDPAKTLFPGAYLGFLTWRFIPNAIGFPIFLDYPSDSTPPVDAKTMEKAFDSLWKSVEAWSTRFHHTKDIWCLVFPGNTNEFIRTDPNFLQQWSIFICKVNTALPFCHVVCGHAKM